MEAFIFGPALVCWSYDGAKVAVFRFSSNASDKKSLGIAHGSQLLLQLIELFLGSGDLLLNLCPKLVRPF